MRLPTSVASIWEVARFFRFDWKQENSTDRAASLHFTSLRLASALPQLPCLSRLRCLAASSLRAPVALHCPLSLSRGSYTQPNHPDRPLTPTHTGCAPSAHSPLPCLVAPTLLSLDVSRRLLWWPLMTVMSHLSPAHQALHLPVSQKA